MAVAREIFIALGCVGKLLYETKEMFSCRFRVAVIEFLVIAVFHRHQSFGIFLIDELSDR